MIQLLELPPGLLEDEVCQYLDARSFSCLSSTTRQLHEETRHSKHWATHVAKNYGIVVDKLVLMSAAAEQKENKQQQTKTNISWRDVFFAAWFDSRLLSTAQQEADVLQLYHMHPPISLHGLELQIRKELVLMQALCRFPNSVILLQLYAQVIRQELGRFIF